MNKTVKLIISGILVLAVMAMIFFFSSQSKDDSKAVSNSLAEKIIRILDSDYDNKTESEKADILSRADVYVRKGAHITEYALLGITLAVFFWNMKKKWYIPVTIGVIYAASDEIHQIFAESRGPMVTDVLIDISGLLVGMALAALVICLVYKRKNKSNEKCIEKGNEI